ncbi:MAG: glycosidase, partial [Planctomycetota bacterium]
MRPNRADTRTRLLVRHHENPLLSGSDWPYFVNTVFNAGAARLPSGETVLLCRVEDCSGISHLSVARSPNGLTGWKIDAEPTLLSDPEAYPEEQWGIEDPRVVWMPELQKFGVTYTCYSPSGPGVSLALTRDFRKFERIGNIMPPEDKDAALLPRRIGDRWALIHRPVSTTSGAHIWISFSPDLVHWGEHTIVMHARRGPWWDANKIGLSPPLIETEEGWLLLYHGVRQTASGCLYRIGLALLDLEDPSRCLLRSDKWIFGPEADYERIGDVWDVVFP